MSQISSGQNRAVSKQPLYKIDDMTIQEIEKLKTIIFTRTKHDKLYTF